MINQPLNPYPYSIDDDRGEKQQQQAELQRHLVAQQHLELMINLAAGEEQN